ncbi:urease accessory protein UreE [Tumidithrix elongata RA019]|uniref:Urease accessory protein UreE n=1 Tax=Tumidithrix elongata BACA0141 TaxID=2716417 RepID=A0AAW9Q2A2_9CYAN|nr:urease accessory protein UreE [Tumidithrix elongata RA019]
MLVLTQRLSTQNINSAEQGVLQTLTLALDAEERTRSRHRFVTVEGKEVNLQLPRGTVLLDGDLLKGENHESVLVKVIAKPEPVITATAHSALELLRAAYHLGNRHVPLEVTTEYLRLSPDSVLQNMLEQLGLHVKEEILPFQPESGAYGSSSHSSHSHSDRGHSHAHNHDR